MIWPSDHLIDYQEHIQQIYQNQLNIRIWSHACNDHSEEQLPHVKCNIIVFYDPGYKGLLIQRIYYVLDARTSLQRIFLFIHKIADFLGVVLCQRLSFIENKGIHKEFRR